MEETIIRWGLRKVSGGELTTGVREKRVFVKERNKKKVQVILEERSRSGKRIVARHGIAKI